jgi:hypothetical protein
MRKQALLLATAAFVMLGGAGAVWAHGDEEHDETVLHNALETAQPVTAEDEELGDGDVAPPVPTDPMELVKERDDETIKQLDDHFTGIYGSKEGPMKALEETEKKIEAGHRRNAAYNMTYEQRQEFFRQEMEAKNAADGKAAVAAPESTVKVYNRAAPPTKTPPRLFNNVQ